MEHCDANVYSPKIQCSLPIRPWMIVNALPFATFSRQRRHKFIRPLLVHILLPLVPPLEELNIITVRTLQEQKS
jgi:hypothetical protein